MLESSRGSFRGREMMQKGGRDDDDGVRTVECLRGRLLAERVASKAAKDEADLLAKRLEELERQVGEEIKCRNRAEKRLEHALKKLESLKLLNLSESSAGSSESLKIEAEMQFTEPPGNMKEMRKEMGLNDDVGSPSVDSATDQMISQEGSWCSVGTGHSQSKEPPLRDEDSKKSINNDARQGSFNTDEMSNAVNSSNYSDDTLALVPVGTITPRSSSTSHSSARIDNVEDVLLALKLVKLRLRNSLERRAAVISSPKMLYGQ